MPGWGSSTKNRWLYGQADGFLRHHRAAASVAEPGQRKQPAHV